jgi:hypothetical protein
MALCNPDFLAYQDGSRSKWRTNVRPMPVESHRILINILRYVYIKTIYDILHWISVTGNRNCVSVFSESK